MPRDGSGGYLPPQNSWNPAINGAQALPNDWQAILNDLAAAIQASLAADGQTPVTGIMNFQNNRISNVGAPLGAGDVLRFNQMQKGPDIPSAATIAIPIEGNLFDVTGTTGISTINDTFPGRIAWLRFQDSVTLTHSNNLLLPGAINLTTSAADILCAINIVSGVWAITSFVPMGSLLNVQVFDTPGTYTYTPTSGTRSVIVEAQAGGGASGGNPTTNSSQQAISRSGGGGACAKSRFTTGFNGVLVTVGAGGSVGAAGAAGNNGGASSFGSLVSVGGGYGGGAGIAGVSMGVSGAGGGDVISGSYLIGINGGNGPASSSFALGFAAISLGGAAGGGYPSTYGNGGASKYNGPSTATPQVGFSGTGGIVIVWEYA